MPNDTNTTLGAPGIEYNVQYICSKANDNKLLYAFPGLSNHIVNLPNLPIFLVPGGADLLTGSYTDGSSGNSSWKGDGDEIFFAQGGSRIATGIGNNLTVITGYEFAGARNFLVDFDPANDRCQQPSGLIYRQPWQDRYPNAKPI